MRQAVLHPQRGALQALSHVIGDGKTPPTILGKALGAEELKPGDPRLPDSFRANGWGGLLADMALNMGSQAGRDGFSNVKFGAYDEWSFMFLPEDVEPIPPSRRAAPNHLQDIKAITQIVEFSPVVMGANPATLTVGAKNTLRRSAALMPSMALLAITQMAIDAGREAGLKHAYGSWWQAHLPAKTAGGWDR